MTKIDYTKLKQLREETGVSFSYCKKALEETGNDIEKAKDKLNEWGAEQAAKKSDRVAEQGGIFSYVHHNKKMAAMVELRCETDFVGGNEEFQTLGKEFAMHVAAMNPDDMEGFMKQAYVRDSSKTIEQIIKDSILKFGENIKVVRFVRWGLGE